MSPTSDPPAAPAPDPDWGRALLVFVAAVVFGALTALPGAHWFDSAEFASVARRLSISHPPGHPLHALTTHGVQLLPGADLWHRANLASVLALSLALAGLYRLIRAAAPRVPWWVAAGAALLPGLTPAGWLQGSRSEVYALQALISVAIGHAALRVLRGDARALALLAFAFGLAGSNHSYTGVTLMPGALLAVGVGLRRAPALRRLRTWAAATVAGLAGLSTYLYLPLRATAGGEVGWGRPDTLPALWSTVSARDWQPVDGPTTAVDPTENLVRVLAWGIDQVELMAAAALLVVFVLGVVARGRIGLWAGVLLFAAGPVAGCLLWPFDAGNPDMGGYLLPAIMATAVAVVAAGEGLHDRTARWLVPIAIGLAIGGAVSRYDVGARQGSRGAERHGRAMLAEVPVEGALVISDFGTWFLGWGLRALEGDRPDVALVYRGRVGQAWFAERLAGQAPGWAERLSEFPDAFLLPAVRFEPGVEGRRLGAALSRLRGQGLTLGAGLASVPLVSTRARFATLGAAEDVDTRRYRAFLHALHAEHLLDHDRNKARGRLHAGWHLERAEALIAGDPWLAALRRRLVERTRPDGDQKALDALGGG